MAEKGVSFIFDDDVRMGFKDGHNLIGRIYRQSLKDSFLGLVNDTKYQINGLHEIGGKGHGDKIRAAL